MRCDAMRDVLGEFGVRLRFAPAVGLWGPAAEVNKYANEGTCKILVGNKCDATEQRQVRPRAAECTCRRTGRARTIEGRTIAGFGEEQTFTVLIAAQPTLLFQSTSRDGGLQDRQKRRPGAVEKSPGVPGPRGVDRGGAEEGRGARGAVRGDLREGQHRGRRRVPGDRTAPTCTRDRGLKKK